MMRRALVFRGIAVATFFVPTSLSAAAPASLPSWVTQLTAARPLPKVVEEVSYEGKRALEVHPGDRRADSGNEHVLLSDQGRVICEFGGYVPRVTSGSCDIGKIVYVRAIFPPRAR
jgi:hypothetical protein